ncbi:MAG: UDP-N-acetylmuramoyl-L-alanyl-D-glutamate--2,6-diaminopimelate ligase [Candidatus Pacebacteria bacterium]|nr:UDP-N-acetylmuramoyl-L-alanyl-D-glutamate--2,6-diaminopimelate ligase [Candidatus Paceibacterota bacterium]
MKELIKKITPSFLIDWYHFLLAFLGALLYRFPGKKMTIIGITGTKGKSTVVDFCHRIFQEAGHKTASLSSIRFKINSNERPNMLKMTMPGRFQIQRFLREALDYGCKYAILEVTSEGILQHRHKFIDFKTAVFTNLAPEHIERHGSFENYRRTKGQLFKAVRKIHIINSDDENKDYFLTFPAEKKYLYGIKNKKQEIKLIDKKAKILKEIKDVRVDLKLLGQFNLFNALAAICVGLSEEINLPSCKAILEKIEKMPGRMEIVIDDPFKVIVDYAHTPDALEKVYQSLKGKRLICLLGSAGGGRDKWKRPKMGEIAAKYCDEIILTDEDPYDEDPKKILEEVFSGIASSKSKKQKSKVFKVLDRRKAIKKSLKLAKEGDTVVITGKGCEPWMCVARDEKIAWDDRQIVREEFELLNKKKNNKGE